MIVKDGQDEHGLQSPNLKKLRLNFSRCAKCDVALLTPCQMTYIS